MGQCQKCGKWGGYHRKNCKLNKDILRELKQKTEQLDALLSSN